jgi:peptidoglycan/LPS O-acetylase OafA/YrhL
MQFGGSGAPFWPHPEATRRTATVEPDPQLAGIAASAGTSRPPHAASSRNHATRTQGGYRLSAPAVSTSYRRDIDGLRAIAVIAVVCYHAFPSVVPGGFVGVDVFFVISGYLITGLIASDLADGSFTIPRFYARRIRRIFPALAVVLAACLAVGWLVLLPNEYDQLAQHTAGGAGFCVNFLLWRESGYFDAAAEVKPLLHLWSLGIEEQFYVLWPLLLAIAARTRRAPLAFIVPLLAASFAWNLVSVAGSPVAAFYSPATRLWELAVGGALASMRWRLPRTVAPIGLALIVASVIVLRSDRAFPGWWAVLPVAGTALAIGAGSDSAVARVLANRAAVFIGLISYPLYLWHWSALAFARILTSGTPSLAVRVVAIAGSALAAWLTYRWIEKPIRTGKRRVVVPLVVAMIALAAAGLAVHLGRGVPSRMPEPLREIASLDYDFETDARVDRCWLVATAPADGFAPECVDDQATIFVWGDSHAARLFPGIRAVTSARVAQLTRASCPPILDFGYERCVESNAYGFRRLREIHPEVVVMFAAWAQHSTSWRADDPAMAALARTIRAVRDAGVPRVVVVGPAPAWEETLPRIVLNASVGGELPRRTRHGLNPVIEPIDGAMARIRDADYVSAWRALCDADGCLTHVEGGLVSWDYGHLTTPGATFLAKQLPLQRR